MSPTVSLSPAWSPSFLSTTLAILPPSVCLGLDFCLLLSHPHSVLSASFPLLGSSHPLSRWSHLCPSLCFTQREGRQLLHTHRGSKARLLDTAQVESEHIGQMISGKFPKLDELSPPSVTWGYCSPCAVRIKRYNTHDVLGAVPAPTLSLFTLPNCLSPFPFSVSLLWLPVHQPLKKKRVGTPPHAGLHFEDAGRRVS